MFFLVEGDAVAAAEVTNQSTGYCPEPESWPAVSAPRSFGPLEAVACDTARPAPIRSAAGATLRGLDHVALDLPADKLRRWWIQGDAVLRRQALLFVDGIRCPDIVVTVAADST